MWRQWAIWCQEHAYRVRVQPLLPDANVHRAEWAPKFTELQRRILQLSARFFDKEDTFNKRANVLRRNDWLWISSGWHVEEWLPRGANDVGQLPVRGSCVEQVQMKEESVGMMNAAREKLKTRKHERSEPS